MNQTLSLLIKNIKPFSTNESISWNKRGKSYRSTNKDNFQKRMYGEMLRHRAEVFSYESLYSPYDHFLVGSLYVFIPKNKLITKENCVSQKSGDVNNHKVFTDCIFKGFEKLDDSYLIKENQFKGFSPDQNYHMAYKIEIEDLECLDKWSKDAWDELSDEKPR